MTLIAVSAWPLVANAQDAGGLPIGAPAPLVTVVDSAGRPAAIPARSPRPVLIEFWATWCEYCARLEPRMKAAYARFHDRVDFYAVAVNVNESATRVFRHARAHTLPFAVWYDESGSATRAFDVAATSYVVVLDTARHVAYSGLGDAQDLDGVLARITRTRADPRTR